MNIIFVNFAPFRQPYVPGSQWVGTSEIVARVKKIHFNRGAGWRRRGDRFPVHQRGPGSIYGRDAISGLSLLVLYSFSFPSPFSFLLVGGALCSRGFSPGTPDFPSPQKPTFDIRYFDLIRLTVSPVSRALVLA